MSLWSKYLAPGDVRRRQQIRDEQDEFIRQEVEKRKLAKPATPPRELVDPAQRVRRQNALLFGGAGFTLLSLFVTRRSLMRKRLHTPVVKEATTEPPKADGALEAAEALGIATLNVMSMFMLACGAAAKYFDIGDLEDIREQYRRAAGYDADGGEGAANSEIELWVAETLAKGDGQGNLREGVAQKTLELQELEAGKRGREKGG